jgi:hypothetical protein
MKFGFQLSLLFSVEKGSVQCGKRFCPVWKTVLFSVEKGSQNWKMKSIFDGSNMTRNIHKEINCTAAFLPLSIHYLTYKCTLDTAALLWSQMSLVGVATPCRHALHIFVTDCVIYNSYICKEYHITCIKAQSVH